MPFGAGVRNEIILQKFDEFPMIIIKIEKILFTHGMYDWIITFYASTLVSAKKFVDGTIVRLGKYLQESLLIETLAPIRKQGLKKP